MPYTLFHNITLIDGCGGPPLPRAAVLVEDNRIRAVGPEATLSLPNDELTMLDGEGGALLPGLIDTHVHLMLEGGNIPAMMMTPFSLNFYRAINYMRRTVQAGITSVRDAGGADLGVKRAVEEGLVLGPRMQISITVLTTTGGHGDGWMPSGTSFDIFPPYPGVPDGRVDGPEAVRGRVREILRSGADVIKVCSTGGVMSPTDDPTFTQFSPEELAVMVQEGGYRRGIKVMAHAQGAEGIKNAVRAGIHSIEHGIFLDDEAIELMLERGTYLVPTLLAPVAVLEQAKTAGAMPEYGVRKAREAIDAHQDSIARAYKAGVKIAMGTDAGVAPHGTNLRELALMCGIGMSPMEAIVATTKVAAECMGWQDRLGTVEAGKLADLVLVRRDPLTDIDSLADQENIAVVMMDGKIVADRRSVADRQTAPA
ncbi:MAG: amidohydrolase family protein [Anaerolineae bacterium]|nr:amidohydrolase family protein [Anaerolineae bacterium]